jgi:hypothetical protein
LLIDNIPKPLVIAIVHADVRIYHPASSIAKGGCGMLLKNHKLYKKALSNVELWVPANKRSLAALIKISEDESLSQKQRYEIESFLWCSRLSVVFSRLKKIREMGSRSMYKKKGEDKSKVINDWMLYNYQLYTVTYQSISEVALLLTNAILDLGNPPKNCTYGNISENRRVKAAGLVDTLKTLMDKTKEHRERKNLLVHRGKAVRPPVTKAKIIDFDVSGVAEAMGTDEETLKANLQEFLAKKSREHLYEKIESECEDIKLVVAQLFDELYPHYLKLRSFY